MVWKESYRADPEARPIADRHYNRQKPGSAQFVPPGRCIVLLAEAALWVTSYPYAKYVKHAWAGAWVNSSFRKECEGKASEFIRQAIAATRYISETDAKWDFGRIPELGIISFIDPIHVAPRKIRRRSTWGHSYFEAGFRHVGYTKAGLWTFQMLPHEMPEATAPISLKGAACSA